MQLEIGLLGLARDLAQHAAARQTVIARNIAHSDTPGYRARDLPDFAAAFAGGGMAATRPGHLSPEARQAQGAGGAQVVTAPGAASPNGNTVSLEDQMTRLAQVRQQHDLALGVYQKSMDVLRLALGR